MSVKSSMQELLWEKNRYAAKLEASGFKILGSGVYPQDDNWDIEIEHPDGTLEWFFGAEEVEQFLLVYGRHSVTSDLSNIDQFAQDHHWAICQQAGQLESDHAWEEDVPKVTALIRAEDARQSVLRDFEIGQN